MEKGQLYRWVVSFFFFNQMDVSFSVRRRSKGRERELQPRWRGRRGGEVFTLENTQTQNSQIKPSKLKSQHENWQRDLPPPPTQNSAAIDETLWKQHNSSVNKRQGLWIQGPIKLDFSES